MVYATNRVYITYLQVDNDRAVGSIQVYLCIV